MRKIRFMLTYVPVILLAGTFFISPARAEEKFPFLAEVSRPSVNVRAGANTNFEAIDKLTAGAEVVVLAHSYEWYKVQLPLTAAAYIRADYIKEDGTQTGVMTGDRVNVRAKPSNDASTLGQLRKDEGVKLLGKVNGWWQIEPPAGTYGWIHQDFLKLKSAEVPDGSVRKAIVVAAVSKPAPAAAAAKEQPAAAAPVTVTVQGRLEPVVDASAMDARYQILVQGKPVYYLQDTPHLDRFNHTSVKVEGTIAKNDKTSVYPVLHIKTISLVL